MRLELGDKSFDMKPLTLNDWVKAEEMGVQLTKLGGATPMAFKDMRAIIYLALKRANPDDAEVTPEWVGDNIDLSDTEKIKEIVDFISVKESSKEV